MEKRVLLGGNEVKHKKVTWECETWQANKHETTLTPELLQPSAILVQAWSEIAINFIESLSLSNGHNTIKVVVDRYTKYGHFMALGHPFTTRKVAQVFVNGVFKLHGVSKNIVSDHDSLFLSSFWKTFFTLQGSTLNYGFFYHPQSDGQS